MLNLGLPVSCTLNEHVAWLFDPSVNVYVTVVGAPAKKTESGACVRVRVGTCPELSVATGSIHDIVAEFWPAGRFMMILFGQLKIIGGFTSPDSVRNVNKECILC